MPNIYSIYIKNFWRQNSSGTKTYIQTRELVYTVPISDPNRAFIDPVVKCEMGKAGSMEFTVLPNNPYFNAWQQMKTLLYVEYDGTTIFHGRVLTVSDNTFTGNRKIHCEGDLAFLLDSIQPMSREEDRTSISLANYIHQILAKHNQQMYEAPTHDTEAQGIGGAVSVGPNGSILSDPEMEKTDKVFYAGEIPGEYSGSTQTAQRISNPSDKFGSKGWEPTLNALEDLNKRYGGYFRTRYSTYTAAGREWDICYLDWMENYFRNNDSEAACIEVAKNLIDINSSTEVDNIFTVLVPVGSKEGKELFLDGYQYRSGATWNGKYITVPDLVRLWREGVIPESKLNVGYHTTNDYATAITNYGYIYKPQKFDNADTQAKLFEYAVDWIASNYIGGLTSFTVSALDLHHYNPSIYTNKYLAGDRVKVRYPDPDRTLSNPSARVTKTLTIISAEYHLHNPEKDTYSIGTPNQILTRTYGTAATGKKTKTKTSVGQQDKQKKAEKEINEELGKVDETLWSHVISNYYNHNQYEELDPTQTKNILKSQYLFLKQANERPKGSAGLLLDGWNGKIQFDADNPRDEKMALKKMEMYGDNFKYIRHIIEGEKITSTVGFTANSDGLVGGSQVMLGQDAEGNKVAINLDGLDGLMSMFGIDGSSGEMFKSIDISGFQNFLKFFNKDGGTTAETDGTDGSAGFGGKTTNPDTGEANWNIGVNKKIKYKGSDGKIHETTKEIVSAKDFYIAEVPSFKTELAVINTALIDVAHIGDLTAINAFIQNLTGEKATIERISAQKIYASNWVNAGVSVSSPTYNWTGGSDEGSPTIEGNCFSNCLVWAGTGSGGNNNEKGKIYFEFTSLDGKKKQTVNFSIADTQTYKDAVSAAWDNGGKTAYLKWSGSTDLNPGGSVQIFAYYKDHNNTADCTPSGSPNYVKVTAKDTRAANWNAGGQTAYANVDKASLSPGGKSTITVYYKNYSGSASSTGRTYNVTANTDSNLSAGNIKKDVTIFGVKGTYSGSGGASGCYVDLYPNGDSDITTTNSQPTGTTPLAKLATALYNADQYQWVSFYAVVKDSSGNVVSGSRKRYTIRQLIRK